MGEDADAAAVDKPVARDHAVGGGLGLVHLVRLDAVLRQRVGFHERAFVHKFEHALAGGGGPGCVHCVDRVLTDRGLRLIQAVAQILDAARGGGHVGFG